MILGIKIEMTKNSIFTSQTHFIEKMLKMLNSFGVYSMITTYDLSMVVNKNMDFNVSNNGHTKTIRSVMFCDELHSTWHRLHCK